MFLPVVNFTPVFTACGDSEFECSDDGRCIPANERCNGVANCYDETDEVDCPCKSRVEETFAEDSTFAGAEKSVGA